VEAHFETPLVRPSTGAYNQRRTWSHTGGVVSGLLEQATEEWCPECLGAAPADGPAQVLGTARWRIIFGWGRRTAYPVAFECPNGHSSTAIGQLQRWFSVREL
jgi:hypothetical protein